LSDGRALAALQLTTPAPSPLFFRVAVAKPGRR